MNKNNNNILIFTPFFYPHIGGVERYIEEVSLRLIQRGYGMHIVTFTNDGKRNEIYKGIHIHRVKVWFMTAGGVGLIVNILPWRSFGNDLFNKYNFSYINTHTRIFASSIFGAKMSIKHRVPLIHTEHGAVLMGREKTGLSRYIIQFLDKQYGRFIMRTARSVVAISLPGVNFCENVMGAKDVSYIPNGIDSGYWKPQKISASGKEIKLLYVGRLVEDKGVQYLVEALEDMDNFSLTIVGDGPFLNQLKLLTESFGIADRVKFVGPKTSNEIRSYLSASDYFINPSLAEGLPTTVLEALSMGVSTIATNVGGTSSILSLVPEYSWLIKPSSNSSLRTALREAFAKKYLSMEDKLDCHEKISSKFDWNTIVDKLEHIFSNDISV